MSAAGTRVSAGRLRVDAARAVDKLREYQLPDPTMWVLEVVRAAVALDATRIAVTGDVDDVRVSWEGPAPEPDDLARLFDELVNPAPTADRRPLRLLATGVNTALGLDPRWIDVVTVDGSGSAHRVRYTPELLEAEDGGAAEGLRALRAEAIVPPPDAPSRGGIVHLRRLPLWSAVPIMVGFGEPPELSVVRRCCDDLSVPISVGRTELSQRTSHHDLLRLSLGEGLDGFLALVDPTAAGELAVMDVAEHGVLLSRYTLHLPALSEPRGPIPLRLFVDAPRMPTNASRSAVRLDEPPVRDARERARERFGELVAVLARELGEAPAHRWTETQVERLRAAALSLLAARVAGEGWRQRVRGTASDRFPEALSPLVRLPLLRDALGRPRAAQSFPVGEGDAWVHFGPDPVGPELEPWLGHALWVPPGDPARALLGSWIAPRAERFARRASRLVKAREAFFAEAARPAELARAASQLVSVPLRAPGKSLKSCAPLGLFDVEGLEGELAVCDPRRVRDGAVSLRIEGREMELVDPELPLPVAAVVGSRALRPRDDYAAVRRDEAYDAVRGAVAAAAVVACEALALRMRGKRRPGDRASVRADWIEEAEGADEEALSAILRRGVALAHALEAATREGPHADAMATDALARSKSPLIAAPIWPILGGTKRISTRALLREARTGAPSLEEDDAGEALAGAPGAIGFTTAPVSGGAAPSLARSVLVIAPDERGALERLVRPARLVDYRPAWPRPLTTRAPGALARSIVPALGVALEITGDDFRAAIAWGDQDSVLEVRHWDRPLDRTTLQPLLAPYRVVVDDGRVIPAEDWRGIHPGSGRTYPLHAWQVALARAFIDALAGTPDEALAVGPGSAADASRARVALLTAIAEADAEPREWLGDAHVDALLRVPMVRTLGEAGTHTLETIAERFDGAGFPFVSPLELSSVDLEGWHPVSADALESRAYGRLLEREPVDGTDHLDALRRRARRAVALERHRRQPPSDPCRDWSDGFVEVPKRGFRSARVTFGLQGVAQAGVDVLIEGRRFARSIREGLPLRMVIDFDETAADVELAGLTPAAERTIDHAIAAGARALLRRVIADDPRGLWEAPPARRLLRLWLDTAAGGASRSVSSLRSALAAAPAFVTVQGEPASLDDAATSAGTLRVASWEEPWIGPDEGERSSAYDRAVLRLPPADDERAELSGILHALWSRGRIKDVTAAVGRLQAERRVARGLAELPRLSDVRDPRFRYPLDALLEDDAEALEALGIGEAALSSGPRSRVLVFEGGVHTRTVEAHLVPPVEVACQSPLLRRRSEMSDEVRARLQDGLRDVTSAIVRRVVDETPPDQLPVWVRDQLRFSCMVGGALHLDRLLATPLFPSTSGAWITPGAIRDQHARFGRVWWTSDPEIDWAPVEEGRFALTLTRGEAASLEAWVDLFDATRELALDRVARRNRERPPVTSLDPSPAEAAAAAVTIPLSSQGDDGSHGTVVVLKPGFEALRGLELARARHPLGRLPDPARWPAASRIDDPQLSPNRTWDAPEDDLILDRLRARIDAAVDEALAAHIPFPTGKAVALRVRAARADTLGLPEGVVVEGVAWLEEEATPGRVKIRMATEEHERVPHGATGEPLPLHGELWIAGALPAGRLTSVFAALYDELLDRLGAQLRDGLTSRREPATIHLIQGARLGVRGESLHAIPLEQLRPPCSLGELLVHLDQGGFVRVVAPEDAERASSVPSPSPLFVDDGSTIAAHLAQLLGGRTTPWQHDLRARVLGDSDAPAPPAAPAPISVPETVEETMAAAAPRRSASPFERALGDRLDALRVGSVREVRVDGRRKRPTAWIEGEVLWLAGRHRVVRAAIEAVEVDAVETDALLTLLLARGAGALHRGAGRIGAGGENAILIELLEEIGESARSTA